MQTDPNWSNFFYNEEDGKVWLFMVQSVLVTWGGAAALGFEGCE